MKEMQLIRFSEDAQSIHKIDARARCLDPDKQLILFVEPYGVALSLLKRAISRGFHTAVFTANKDLCKVPQALLNEVDLAIQVDTSNEAKLRILARLVNTFHSVSAVIPGFEYFVPIASKLSQDLQVPGIDPKDVMKLRSKDQMRLTMQKAGLSVPRFRLLHDLNDLPSAIQEIGFPAICKPVDAAGSVHVKKVMNLEEADAAASRILLGQDVLWGHRLAASMLLEEYVEGKEYSVEGIVQNDQIQFFSITEKFVADEQEFVEIGHIANVPLQPGLKQSIETYLEAVIKVLGARHCPFHAELRINAQGEPILMEIAARLAGDRIGDLINLARGINYYDAILATYLGQKLDVPVMDNSHAGIRFFYRPEVESYSELRGLEELGKLPIVDLSLYYESMQNIPAFPKPLRRLGHVIIKDDNYEDLVQALKKADDLLIFKAKVSNVAPTFCGDQAKEA